MVLGPLIAAFLSMHAHTYHTTTHTYMLLFNFSIGKVMQFLVIQPKIKIVKFLVQFHVIMKNCQTNAFHYPPTVSNTGLNIPCLFTLSLCDSTLCVLCSWLFFRFRQLSKDLDEIVRLKIK